MGGFVQCFLDIHMNASSIAMLYTTRAVGAECLQKINNANRHMLFLEIF